MIKKYYYLLAVPIICLLFSTTVNAAQSSHTVNFTDSDGLTLNIRYQDHSVVDPSGYYEEHDTAGHVTGYTYTWDLSENVDVVLTQGKYYTGYITTRLTWTSNISGITLSQATINSVNTNNGMYVYISTISSNYIQIQWVFDNYYTGSAATLGTATLNLKFTYRGALTTPYLNITNTVTQNNNLHGYTTVQNNALTAMIYSAIYQGVGPDMQTIVNMLTGIRNQDYTYYNSILNGLSQLHADNQANYNQLLAILNEIDVDFAAIQTVLDLFPSYRTAVLQYWQDLLEMSASQSSAAAEIESQYADKEEQSATLAAGLGSLTLPSVNANDFDILSRVDSGQKTNFFGLLSIITNNSYITTLLLIICTGAIVGFILYGKKS